MASAPIDRVTTSLLAVPVPESMRFIGYDHVNIPFVEICTADGAIGTGFSYTFDSGASIICLMIDEIAESSLLGTTVDDWDDVRRATIAATRRLGATTFTVALSAIDIGMWDLRGIEAAAPIWRLLGGQPRPLPIYGSGRSGFRMTADQLVEHSVAYLEEGYHGVKLGVGAYSVDEDIARIKAVRDAIGPDVDVMVDANERLTVAHALALGERMAEHDIVWFEEPILTEDIRGHAELARRLAVPIATGEHLQGTPAFEQYFDLPGIRFYQPDAALGGGLTTMREVAERAADGGHALAWHALPDLHVHLATVAPTTAYLEDFAVISGLQATRLLPDATGSIAPTELPGHGIQWDRDAVEAYRVG